MARFTVSDVTVATRPRSSTPGWTATGPPADYTPTTPFASYLNSSGQSEAVNQVAQLAALPTSGYDAFTAAKSLSTNRPHLIAAYNPALNIANINNPLFQLAEVQYLLDSDSISTTTQLISASLSREDQQYVSSFNDDLFLQSKKVLDALRSVYSSKRLLSRFLAGFGISSKPVRSLDYRNNLPARIGFSNLFIDDICREPFFGKSKLDDYFASIPTAMSDFKEKTFASRVFNLALMSNDLCFFPQSVVSTFKESDAVGDFASSALYVRSSRYPAEAVELPDYITRPADDTLEQCMIGLARMIAEIPPFKTKKTAPPLNVYDAYSLGGFPANVQDILGSFFFRPAGSSTTVETFSRSSFSNAMPDGYASFEDSALLPSFSKDQRDSDGFRQASTNVAARNLDLSSRVEAFAQATSRFSPIDPESQILRFASAVLNIVGDVLTWLEIDRFSSSENEFEWSAALLDIACIVQRANSLRDNFSEILPTNASGIEIVFPQISPGSGDSLNFDYGDAAADDEIVRKVVILGEYPGWTRTGLYESVDVHPVFSRIDGAIRINLGENFNESQMRAFRSFAIQLIGSSLKNIFIRLTNSDTEINSAVVTFYRTDLAAIARAINYTTSGAATSILIPGDENLASPQGQRVGSSLRKVQQNIFSSFRTLTDQAMLSLEVCDIGESVRSTISTISSDLPAALVTAANTIQSVNSIRGITPAIALTREGLIHMSSELARRLSPSGYQYYNSKEVMSEQEFKLACAKVLDDTLAAADEDDLTYYFVGFPHGFLERCRASNSLDTDTFNVTFRFVVGDVSSEVVKTFSPNLRKQEILPGDAQEPITAVSPNIVRCLSYVDGIQDLTTTRLGNSVFSVIETSRNPAAQSALASGVAADFVWTLLGLDFSETLVFDSATYSEPTRNSQIRVDQERMFSQKISSLDNTTKARLGSAFQKTNLFGQSRSIDDVFGFKYFDCVYAFPVKASEAAGIDTSQVIGRVFISVDPSTTITKGSF